MDQCGTDHACQHRRCLLSPDARIPGPGDSPCVVIRDPCHLSIAEKARTGSPPCSRPFIFLSVNTVKPSLSQKCSKFTLVTRFPVQEWAISWARKGGRILEFNDREEFRRVTG